MGVRNIFIERRQQYISQLKIIRYIELDNRDDEKIQAKNFIKVSSWDNGKGKYGYKKSSICTGFSEKLFHSVYRKPYSNELFWLILNITGQRGRDD